MENKENKRKRIIGEMIFIELKMFSVFEIVKTGRNFEKMRGKNYQNLGRIYTPENS